MIPLAGLRNEHAALMGESSLKRIAAIAEFVSTVAIACASIAFIWLVARGDVGWRAAPQAAAQAPPQPPRQAVENIESQKLTLDLSERISMPKSGSTVLVEFSDFQCPFCGKYARDTFGDVRKEWLDNGIIGYAFKHFPLSQIHPFAIQAAIASECSRAEGKFEQMQQAIFGNQQSLAPSDLERYAVSSGLSPDKFKACMEKRDVEEFVRRDQKEGQQVGVSGTPTIFVGTVDRSSKRIHLKRRISGAQPLAVVSGAIKEVLSLEKRQR